MAYRCNQYLHQDLHAEQANKLVILADWEQTNQNTNIMYGMIGIRKHIHFYMLDTERNELAEIY